MNRVKKHEPVSELALAERFFAYSIKQDLTASTFSDPRPGRSALDKKLGRGVLTTTTNL